jgi:hypothetical protein
MANACGLYELYRDQLISDHANSLDSKQFSISAPGAIHYLSVGESRKWMEVAEPRRNEERKIEQIENDKDKEK